MIKKMQVPAYPAMLVGVHLSEYTGVEVLAKKVMDIEDIDIDVVSVEPWSISMAVAARKRCLGSRWCFFSVCTQDRKVMK